MIFSSTHDIYYKLIIVLCLQIFLYTNYGKGIDYIKLEMND